MFTYEEMGSYFGDGFDTESLWSKSELGPRLEAELKRMRANGRIGKKDLVRSDFIKIVKEETGITARFKYQSGDNNMDLWVMTPVMDANHVFLGARGQSVNYQEYVGVKGPEEAKLGFVDFKNGRIGGWFSEIMHDIGVGEWFMNDHKTFTAGELVGGILHELGHVFYFYAMLDYAMSTNYYMDFLAKEAFMQPTPEKRVAFLTEKQLRKGDLKRLDEAKTATTQDQLSIVLFKEATDNAKSQLGLPAYDMRGWEFLADRFAIQQGYGNQVSSFIYKIEDWVGDLNQLSNNRWLSVLVTVLCILASLIYFPVTLLVLASFDLQFDIYDKTKQRHKVIRKGIIQNLKYVDEKDKKEILRQVDEMDKRLLKYGEDQRGLWEFLQATFGPTGRKKYRSITTQKLLEHFANSELRVAAERLNHGV